VEVKPMPAYVIVNVEVRNPEPFEEYRQQVGAVVAQYQGRYLAVSEAPLILEGDWRPQQVILLEFPSREAAHACYHSPEYQAILPIRQQHARTDMILVEGLA
jgi:uncharacterized protein (DUF1330 family)